MLEVKINRIKLTNKLSSITLLNNVNFSLIEGIIYTILGKNGSGKTTLINSISKLLDENIYEVNAEINYFGSNLYKIEENTLRNIRKDEIRYVFQDSVNSFDPLKTFGYYFERLKIDEGEFDALLDYLLLPKREKLSGMYSYEVSGGMAQRISMCIALSNKPKLLILDEPTSAIDITISNLLCKKLKEFASEFNAIVLIITQDMDFAENVSDYLAFLKNGNLSEFSKTSISRLNWNSKL